MDRVILKIAKSINEIDEQDKKYMIEQLKSGMDTPDYTDYFARYKYDDNELFKFDLDDETTQQIDEYEDLDEYPEIKQDFDEWMKHEINYNIDNKIDEFKNFGGVIPLYRIMTVDDRFFDNLIKGNPHLGIYWSHEKGEAEAHWGEFEKPYSILLTASIQEEYVDWIETISLNLIPSTSVEKEIRLFQNTPIKIEDIEFVKGNKELDYRIFEKTYYA